MHSTPERMLSNNWVNQHDSNDRYDPRTARQLRHLGEKSMIECPQCSGTLPEDASFCKHCGKPLELNCRNCGESVPVRADFCPNCREQLDTTAGDVPDEDGPFRLKPREFARRIEGSILDSGGIIGWLNRRKEIKIEAGNRALFLENGELVESLGPGRHTLETLTQRIRNLERSKDLSVILVENGETAVDIAIEDVQTSSEFLITVHAEFIFAIDDPERFAKSMLADRNAVTAETFDTILGDAIRDEIQATIAEYDRDELYGNRELNRDLRQDTERQCRSTLERHGLRLLELRSFDYDDDRDDVRESRKQVKIREEKEGIRDDEAKLDRRSHERKTEDKVHEEQQRIRRETAEQSVDHEIETQEIEHEHERKDIQRRHQHKAEREDVEHEEETKITRKEAEAERREIEHEQDVEEMEDLMDLKKKKDMDSLDVNKREQDLEIDREEHEVEIEKERLEARDDVDLETLVSLEDTDADVADLAELEKAENLTPEQLDALGAQDSDELAKARQEAKKAEKERKRVEDQEEFREEMKDMAEDSMDRIQETTESAMDNMGETGKAAAEDTSDNVILSDTGSSDSGDTTIVQGGSGSSDDESDDEPEQVTICPSCDSEITPDAEFCLNCGTEL